MKYKKSLILSLMMVLFMYSTVCAEKVENHYSGEKVSTNNVQIHTDPADDSLDCLTYTVVSTGASAGIRYRTSTIKVMVGNYPVTIDTLALTNGIKPSAGETMYSTITVTKEDLVKHIGEVHRKEIMDLLKDPQGNVTIGATIQLYNAYTGGVIAELNSASDCDIAYNYGFSSTDVNDMKSRFTGGNIPTIPPGNDSVRPSILVK